MSNYTPVPLDWQLTALSPIWRQHPTIMWAKFEALAEGARLASQQLWGR